MQRTMNRNSISSHGGSNTNTGRDRPIDRCSMNRKSRTYSPEPDRNVKTWIHFLFFKLIYINVYK
ncbi:hypothetical protein BDA99DRAFT_506913 [Phascolomyces articulosus]|uniref:Uncharacterized protein n=1 Tax=Phascolomyces articulosus TaxID=60185 RepID=A0AAD5KDJ0_9FUNG|nr:hypothetical protein BDA99DRAFT_506913 [Phascolomyces articulosus]